MILLLSGSGKPGSRTLAMVEAAARVVERLGMEARVWDLAARELPLADGRYHEDPASHPDPRVRELVAAAHAAAGFVVASPVHHNSYSGLLKNCLDHLSIDQFEYKPVALMAFGGSMAAVQVCDHLRTVMRGLWALVLPGQAVSVASDFAEEPGGALTLCAPSACGRIELVARDLVKYAKVGQALARSDARPRS